MNSLSLNLSAILGDLRKTIGLLVVARSYIPFLWFVIARVNRIGQRFDSLYTHWRNGTLPKPGAPRPGRARATRSPAPFRLPRGRNWLVARHGWRVAGYASQFRHWLATPEFVEFLAAVPQARRLLSPLCTMLGATLPPKPEPSPPPLGCNALPIAPSAHPEPPPLQRTAAETPRAASPNPASFLKTA